MQTSEGRLRKSLEKKLVPPLVKWPQGEDDNCCKLLGASLMSPAQKSPPSSNYSSRSSSRYSSRLSSPRSSITATTASSDSGSSNSSRRKSSVGSVASVASHDLRNFCQSRHSRNHKALEKPDLLHSTPALNMEELLLNLQGGNGRRKKQEAEEELDRRRWLQAQKEMEFQREEESRRRQRIENEEWLRRTLEDQAELERVQSEHERLEADREEKQRALEEEARLLNEAKEAKLKELQTPIACNCCDGTGKCATCVGTGCISVTYLSQQVSDSCHMFSGRTMSGCRACGGRQDGSEVLKLDALKGTGRCSTCRGAGKIYLSNKDIQHAMQQAGF